MREEQVRVGEEVALELDAFEVVPLRLGEAIIGEVDDVQVEGGDDELGAGAGEVFQRADDGELAQRRERGLGLVHEVEAPGNKAALVEGEQALAMGGGIGAIAIAGLEAGALGAENLGPEFGPAARLLPELDCHLLGLVGAFSVVGREPEEVLGSRQEAAMGALRPREPEVGGECLGGSEGGLVMMAALPHPDDPGNSRSHRISCPHCFSNADATNREGVSQN